jgi:RNA polymerase sigma-70 factor (ECF subfamily)
MGNYSRFGGNFLGVNGSDVRLLARIGRGDPSALGDLYDAHARLLAFRLRRQGASVEEAEDVLQETFLDVWRTSSAYRGDAEVAAWLWGIAFRKYLMLVRGEVRLRYREERARSTSGRGDEEEERVMSIDTHHALSRLTPDLRQAFEAVAVDGLSTAEAAERLGIPEGTVKSRVHRARNELRKELR